MTRIHATFAAFAVLAMTGSALAQDALSQNRILDIAAENGMASIEEIERDDRHWEVEGRDASGRELELDIHAVTGVILERDR